MSDTLLDALQYYGAAAATLALAEETGLFLLGIDPASFTSGEHP